MKGVETWEWVGSVGQLFAHAIPVLRVEEWQARLGSSESLPRTLDGKCAFRFVFNASSPKPGALSDTLVCTESRGSKSQMQLPNPPPPPEAKSPYSSPQKKCHKHYKRAASMRSQMRFFQLSAEALRQRPEGQCHLQDRASRKLCASASHQQGFFEMLVDGVFGLRASFPDFFRPFTQQAPSSLLWTFSRRGASTVGAVRHVRFLQCLGCQMGAFLWAGRKPDQGRSGTLGAFESVPQACLVGELERSLDVASSSEFGFVSVPTIAFEQSLRCHW